MCLCVSELRLFLSLDSSKNGLTIVCMQFWSLTANISVTVVHLTNTVPSVPRDISARIDTLKKCLTESACVTNIDDEGQ